MSDPPGTQMVYDFVYNTCKMIIHGSFILCREEGRWKYGGVSTLGLFSAPEEASIAVMHTSAQIFI